MEFTILHAIQNLHNPLLDSIMVFLSTIANSGEVWIVIGILLLIFKKSRKTGVVVLLSLLFMLVTSNIVLKNVVMRDRPCWIDQTVQLLIDIPKDYSFPSGHTMAGFASATSIFFYHKRLGIAAYVLASSIAFSRLYLFVHFPTDILGGLIIGIALAFLARWIVEKIAGSIQQKNLKQTAE